MTKKQKKLLFRIVVSLVLTLGINLASPKGMAAYGAFFAVYIIIGYDILRKAFRGIVNGRLVDENFLMAVATVGAFGLAIYSGSSDCNEAVAVMIFYQTGELFHSCAVGKSRRAIQELMDIRPDKVRLDTPSEVRIVPAGEVAVGSVIVVEPGERVALDGVVLEGESALDTSSLTGESMPRHVAPGEEILSGCVNLSSPIRIRTTKELGESTVSRILDMVENAASRKSVSEKFISRVAAVYTPAVCGAALCLATLVPLGIMLVTGTMAFDLWIYRALTFLVISCPCALVISIPLSFFAGMGGASRQGILIKGSNYLEALSRVRHIAFDKTGTLTRGEFSIAEVVCHGGDKGTIMDIAAHAECHLSHPIARSICNAYKGFIDPDRIDCVTRVGGMGVVATLDGRRIAVGNSALMDREGIACKTEDSRHTLVYVALEGKCIGQIAVADSLRAGAQDTFRMLKKQGIRASYILTGDREEVALDIGRELGADKVYSGLLPEDKITVLEEILAGVPRGEGVAFAGDGINDAPVLARSHVGIAMGMAGADAAIEAADVVIMDDDPRKVSKAIAIASGCMRVVRQNIVFCLGVKLCCLVLVTLGYAHMWLGIFADVGIMVLAVLNAMRCFGTSSKDK